MTHGEQETPQGPRSGVGPEAARRAGIAGSATQGLLRETLNNPLDYGYAAGEPTHERTMPRRLVAVLLIAVLTAMSVWAAKDLRRAYTGLAAANAQLVERALDRRATLDAIEADIQAIDSQIRARQEQLIPAPPGELARTNALAGQVGALPIKGEGIVVVLDDREVTDPKGLLRDYDLQVVTNALWSIGAEGVAINGQRLSAGTALRSAGQAILVNLVPIAPPYRVAAVGDSNNLLVMLSQTPATGYLAYLRENYGMTIEIASEKNLELPAAALPVLGGMARPLEVE